MQEILRLPKCELGTTYQLSAVFSLCIFSATVKETFITSKICLSLYMQAIKHGALEGAMLNKSILLLLRISEEIKDSPK